jgi:hypothetical protein
LLAVLQDFSDFNCLLPIFKYFWTTQITINFSAFFSSSKVYFF